VTSSSGSATSVRARFWTLTLRLSPFVVRKPSVGLPFYAAEIRRFADVRAGPITGCRGVGSR
jgi:hypothetical protein